MKLPFFRGDPDPVAVDDLERVLRSVEPGEFSGVIETAGIDYAAVLQVASDVADGMAQGPAADLGYRRQQRLHEYGKALFVAGFVLALKAKER